MSSSTAISWLCAASAVFRASLAACFAALDRSFCRRRRARRAMRSFSGIVLTGSPERTSSGARSHGLRRRFARRDSRSAATNSSGRTVDAGASGEAACPSGARGARLLAAPAAGRAGVEPRSSWSRAPVTAAATAVVVLRGALARTAARTAAPRSTARSLAAAIAPMSGRGGEQNPSCNRLSLARENRSNVVIESKGSPFPLIPPPPRGGGPGGGQIRIPRLRLLQRVPL